jgi:hypothetical protein
MSTDVSMLPVMISVCLGSLVAMAITWDLHVKEKNNTLQESTRSNHIAGLIWSGVAFIIVLGLIFQSWTAVFGVILLIAGGLAYARSYVIFASLWTLLFVMSTILLAVTLVDARRKMRI